MTRHQHALLGCLLLCMLSVPLSAASVPSPDMPAPTATETSRATAPATSASASGPREYTLQVGDILGLTVLGEPTYSGAFPVRADGTVLFTDDMVGAVTVANLTGKQATEAVAKRIGEFVKSPTVLLAISRFKVMVVGEVRQPGQYDMDSGARLMDAVTRAGGAKDERRDLAQVSVARVSGEAIKLNLRAFREDADDSQNPVLQPGDRIHVGLGSTEHRSEYTVSGAVKKPGAYPLDPRNPARIAEAVVTAERWTEDANPRAAQLVRRDGSRVVVDLTQFDQDSTSPRNLALRDGDDLFVPRNALEVSVVGGVKKPGVYHVPVGTSLLEAIAVAGGPDDTAVMRGCAVLRSQPKAERIPANLDRLAKDGDMTQNPALVDRDVVYVPFTNRYSPPKAGTLSTILGIASAAAPFLWVTRGW